MLSVRVVLCDDYEIVYGEIRDWDVWVLVASLSDEPETLEALWASVRRYQPYHTLADTLKSVARTDTFDDPILVDVAHGDTDDPDRWCFIDLAGRTIVSGAEFESPERGLAYEWTPGSDEDGSDEGTSEAEDDEPEPEGFLRIWIDLPADWLMMKAKGGWPETVQQRAAKRLVTPPLDVRRVLFGAPMLHFFAQRLKGMVAEWNSGGSVTAMTSEGTHQIMDNSPLDSCADWSPLAIDGKLSRIHADWLMTPRSDLAGNTPRMHLLADRERIDRVIEHRSFQWSIQGIEPPGISEESQYFQYGGFGTIEIVLYYDLIRWLLRQGWARLEAERRGRTEGEADSLQAFAKWLEARCEEWYASPYEGLDWTQEELLTRNRARLPILDSSHPIDDDCPICRMLRDHDEWGPAFLYIDASHLEYENEFAFSLQESREAWEQEQSFYGAFADQDVPSTIG